MIALAGVHVRATGQRGVAIKDVTVTWERGVLAVLGTGGASVTLR